MEQTKQKTSLETPQKYSITYKSYTIKDLRLIRGTKIDTIKNICKQLKIKAHDVPRSKKELNQFIDFLSQSYIIEQQNKNKIKITKIPENIQEKINKLKEKPKLIINNSQKIININSPLVYEKTDFNDYIDYRIMTTNHNSKTQITLDIFKHCTFFQKILVKNSKYKLPHEDIYFIFQSFFMNGLFNIVNNRIRYLKEKQFIKIDNFYLFDDTDRYYENQLLVELTQTEVKTNIHREDLFSKNNQNKFLDVLCKEVQKQKKVNYSKCQRLIEITVLKQKEFKQDYTNLEIIEQIYTEFFKIYQEKLLIKLNKNISGFIYDKKEFNKFIKEIKNMISYFEYKITSKANSQFSFYKYELTKKPELYYTKIHQGLLYFLFEIPRRNTDLEN